MAGFDPGSPIGAGDLLEDHDGAPLPDELQPEGAICNAIAAAVDPLVSDAHLATEVVEEVLRCLAPVLWPLLPSNDASDAATVAALRRTQAAMELPSAPVERDCSRCRGDGRIANTDDGEPWKDWLDLPLGSAMAVTLGLVKPVPCPACGGSRGTSRESTCPTSSTVTSRTTRPSTTTTSTLEQRRCADCAYVPPCCDSHAADGLCCDPNDCGPCCEQCPTCPITRGDTRGQIAVELRRTEADMAVAVGEVTELRRRAAWLAEAAHVAHKPPAGVHGTDGAYLRDAARRLEQGYMPGGSNCTETVVRLLRTVSVLVSS